MTKSERVIKEKSSLRALLNLTMLAAIVLFSIITSPKISLYVKEGLSLCFEAIIGSVFPFMIITDLVSHTLRFDNASICNRLFEKVFKINGQAISAFLLGAICGFPVGVKLAADMYKRGVITRDECERLIGFSSNMGPAFIISGIGAALCGSIKIGVILYIATLVSSIASGFIISRGKTSSGSIFQKEPHTFCLTDSIKSAVENTVNICGFIIFFSTLCGLTSTVIKNDLVYSFIIPFLEVSNATKKISALCFVPKTLKLVLISFSLSFSGLSIYMQTKSFFTGDKISMRTYLKTKLISAVISTLIMAAISTHI